jgi:hypothetical protein
MPLVVPGLTSNSGDNDQTNKWMNELMGKKIGDTSNETVSCHVSAVLNVRSLDKTDSAVQTFAKTDLPKEHRVIKEGDMSTMDHKPDR